MIWGFSMGRAWSLGGVKWLFDSPCWELGLNESNGKRAGNHTDRYVSGEPKGEEIGMKKSREMSYGWI